MTARAKAIEAALRKCLACMDQETMDADPPEARTRLHDARDDARAALALPVEPEGERPYRGFQADTIAEALEAMAIYNTRHVLEASDCRVLNEAAARIRSALPVEPEGEDDQSARCTCEWVHPMTGTIGADWPAELDPQCRVHGAPNDFPQPRSALPVEEREPVGWLCKRRLRNGSWETDLITDNRAVMRLWEDERHGEEGRDWRVIPLYAAPPQPEASWKVPCPACVGTGHLREAVQAWDVPGAPIPDCPHCEDGVLDLGVLLTPQEASEETVELERDWALAVSQEGPKVANRVSAKVLELRLLRSFPDSEGGE